MSAQSIPDLIHAETANPVLRACLPQTRSSLLERGDLRRFEAGAMLFRKGEPAGKVILLLSGCLQIDKTGTKGRRQVICTMTPQECGGICLLLLGDDALADVHSMEAGEALVVDRVDFQAAAKQDEGLCSAGWRGAADCMAHLSDLVEHLSFHKVAQRVTAILLGRTAKNGDLIHLTQSELAAEVGTTREVVARCLAGLQTGGIIRLGRGRITVMNREKLNQMM
jgi:CRP-like cAMP-binding protein